MDEINKYIEYGAKKAAYDAAASDAPPATLVMDAQGEEAAPVLTEVVLHEDPPEHLDPRAEMHRLAQGYKDQLHQDALKLAEKLGVPYESLFASSDKPPAHAGGAEAANAKEPTEGTPAEEAADAAAGAAEPEVSVPQSHGGSSPTHSMHVAPSKEVPLHGDAVHRAGAGEFSGHVSGVAAAKQEEVTPHAKKTTDQHRAELEKEAHWNARDSAERAHGWRQGMEGIGRGADANAEQFNAPTPGGFAKQYAKAGGAANKMAGGLDASEETGMSPEQQLALGAIAAPFLAAGAVKGYRALRGEGAAVKFHPETNVQFEGEPGIGGVHPGGDFRKLPDATTQLNAPAAKLKRPPAEAVAHGPAEPPHTAAATPKSEVWQADRDVMQGKPHSAPLHYTGVPPEAGARPASGDRRAVANAKAAQPVTEPMVQGPKAPRSLNQAGHEPKVGKARDLQAVADGTRRPTDVAPGRKYPVPTAAEVGAVRRETADNVMAKMRANPKHTSKAKAKKMAAKGGQGEGGGSGEADGKSDPEEESTLTVPQRAWATGSDARSSAGSYNNQDAIMAAAETKPQLRSRAADEAGLGKWDAEHTAIPKSYAPRSSSDTVGGSHSTEEGDRYYDSERHQARSRSNPSGKEPGNNAPIHHGVQDRKKEK